MLRSLVLVLDGIADHRAARDTALGLARATGARLEVALSLDKARIERPEAVPLGAEAFRRHATETLAARLAGHLDALAAETETMLRGEGLDGHLVRLDGDAVSEVAALAETHDLVVVSNALRRRRDEEAVETAFALPLDELVAACVRPLLLVDARPLGPGPAVAAYDGSPGAARALHLALLMGLLAGRAVHVVTVASDRETALAHAERAALLAARHGLAAEAHAVVGRGGFDDELAAQIEAIGPALVLMGAFGRRSWRELLFGAVTRRLLDRVEAPLLLAG